MNDHHFPCPCGAELADECPKCARTNPFGSMRLSMADDNTAKTVLPAEVFDRIAAELDRPARIVQPLLDLARRHPSPAQRRDWFSSQYEASRYDAILPTDADERAAYVSELAHEAEHGPSAGQEAS